MHGLMGEGRREPVLYSTLTPHSCPVGDRLESRYFDRADSSFIGTYDNRATVNMIIKDLHSARQGAGH